MTDQILSLEVRLLLAKYGRRRVLGALAMASEQTLEEVEREILALQQPKQPKRAKPKSADELIAAATGDCQELREVIRILVARFESRAFLPSLRAVEQFVHHGGAQPGRLKSRSGALPLLVATLAKKEMGELKRLLQMPSQGIGDYAVLAREIMGGNKPVRAPEPPAQ